MHVCMIVHTCHRSDHGQCVGHIWVMGLWHGYSNICGGRLCQSCKLLHMQRDAASSYDPSCLSGWQFMRRVPVDCFVLNNSYSAVILCRLKCTCICLNFLLNAGMCPTTEELYSVVWLFPVHETGLPVCRYTVVVRPTRYAQFHWNGIYRMRWQNKRVATMAFNKATEILATWILKRNLNLDLLQSEISSKTRWWHNYKLH